MKTTEILNLEEYLLSKLNGLNGPFPDFIQRYENWLRQFGICEDVITDSLLNDKKHIDFYVDFCNNMYITSSIYTVFEKVKYLKSPHNFENIFDVIEAFTTKG